MYSRNLILTSTGDCSDNLNRLKEAISTANVIVIGAGAGLSASAGLTYSGERFRQYFSDFIGKYGITDMYSGGFYPFSCPEEYWAWWSRHIYVNRYMEPPKDTYRKLLSVVSGKDYFVITTNVDHCFQRSGFDKKRLFCTQGDYGQWQCAKPCHQKTYDNEQTIRLMMQEQKDMKIPTELVPHCPVCGAPMTMNLRCDDTFVEDNGWQAAAERYTNFISAHSTGKILYLELGVGGNTPVIIKYPFWRMTASNADATYACLNLEEALCPASISKQAICLNGDIDDILKRIS